MTSVGYVILAYAVGLGLLVGYAGNLWLGTRRVARYNSRPAAGREP